MKKFKNIISGAIIFALSFTLLTPYTSAKQVWQNSPATEYDGIGSQRINNCVLFARYKVPSLPYGLNNYEDKKRICNSYTAVAGEVAVLPQYYGGSYGHVAYVEKVDGQTITILEGGAGTGHINRRVGTQSQLEIYGYFNPGGLNSGSNAPAPVNSSADMWVSTGNAENVSETNAKITGSAGYSGNRPTEVGLYLGTSSGSMTKVARDSITHSKNPFDIWYDLNSEAGQTLSPGTTYYYKLYGIQNDTEVCGETKSFRTNTPANSNGNNNPASSIADGMYTIAPKCAPNFRLDINGASADSGTNVQIWSANDTNAQKFRITKSGSEYTIIAVCSGKALDVYNGSVESGTNVWQYDTNGTNAQKWYFENASDGYYYIKSALGTYLDVNGAGASDGVNVQTWSFNGSDAQKWKLEATSYASNAGSGENTRTGYIKGTDGELVINSRPAKGYDIGYIPEGSSCTVYPDKQSGNWYWVTYNGVSGYAYGKYIELKDNNNSGNAGSSNSSGWGFPLEGYNQISQYFSSSHPAIDFAANAGTKVYAVKSGTVVKKYTGCNNWSREHGQCKNGGVCSPNHGYSTASGSYGFCNDGFGNGYIIKHDDGTWAEYAHMNYLSDSVYEGGYVAQGTYLGGVSSTGVSTGPHLHFGLRHGDNSSFWRSTAFNPLDYIGTGK